VKNHLSLFRWSYNSITAYNRVVIRYGASRGLSAIAQLQSINAAICKNANLTTGTARVVCGAESM